MANRQYVGARYVPKFYEGSNGNEWDSGVVYEPLTMVTYLGSTYCSKKPVPARTITPNLDKEYWVLTAAYSSQVAELREELEETKTNVQTNTDDITSINNPKILCIGDSYGNGAYNSTDHLNEGWVKYLNDFDDFTCYNYCVSGAGIDNTYGGTSYLDELVSAKNNNVECDIVVLACGSNDYNAYTTILSNLTSIKNYIDENFNAKLYVFWNPISYRMTQGEYYLTYKAYRDACVSLNILFNSVVLNARFTDNAVDTDGVHLRPNGYKAQAYDIGSFIKNGFISDNTFYFTNFNIISKDFRLVKYANDNNVHIRNNFIYFDVTVSSNVELNSGVIVANGNVTIPSESESLLRNMFNTKGSDNFNNFRYLIYEGAIAINGVVSPAMFELNFVENKANIRCTCMNIGGWAFKTITSTDTVSAYIFPKDIAIPGFIMCN